MNYITVRQVAQAWNISERRVQKYCTQGRIPGARKFGNAWQIPGSAPKPADGRTAAPGRTPVPRTGKPDGRAALLPLMNTAFAPGRCRAVLDAMPEGPNRDIATAEYLYFSGQAEAAAGGGAVSPCPQPGNPAFGQSAVCLRQPVCGAHPAGALRPGGGTAHPDR